MNARQLANGNLITRTWDAVGRDRVQEQRQSDNTLIAGYDTNYQVVVDPVTGQNRQQQTRAETVNGQSANLTYLYDATYQLVREQRTGANAYDLQFYYDAAGNRTRKVESGVVTDYSYDAANRLQMEQPGGAAGSSSSSSSSSGDAGVISYGYDANGNQTTRTENGQTVTSTWDDENHLTQVADADGTEGYVYNGEGLRVAKTNATGTVRFVWDGDNLLQEYDAAAGTTQAHYTDYPGEWGGLVSLRRAAAGSRLNRARFNQRRFGQSATPEASRFYGFDQSGHTRVLTDGSQAVTDSYTYQAFGVEVQATGSTVNPFRFGGEVGYYRDSGERTYVRQRHYSTGTGRWLSEDPIGYDGGDANLYRYAGNDPVKYVDPEGLDALIMWGRNVNPTDRIPNPFFFRDIANANARNYERYGNGLFTSMPGSPSTRKAHVVAVRNIHDVYTALREYKNIDAIMYFGHGSSDALYMGSSLRQNKLTDYDICRLPAYNVTQNAYIELGGCDTGGVVGTGKINVAQAFANRFRTSVRAYEGGSSFGYPIQLFGYELFRLGRERVRTVFGAKAIIVAPSNTMPKSRRK